MRFGATFHSTQRQLRRSPTLLVFRLPHHDLGFIVHVLLVDEGDTHPETAECQKHAAEGLKVQLHVVDTVRPEIRAAVALDQSWPMPR